MSIVCGVDFSEPAGQAMRVAAAFARSLDEPLALVHVVDLRALPSRAEDLRAASFEGARLRLAELADELRGAGLRVEERLLSGAPEEAIVELSGALDARLVVVARLGQRAGSGWRGGCR